MSMHSASCDVVIPQYDHYIRIGALFGDLVQPNDGPLLAVSSDANANRTVCCRPTFNKNVELFL